MLGLRNNYMFKHNFSREKRTMIGNVIIENDFIKFFIYNFLFQIKKNKCFPKLNNNKKIIHKILTTWSERLKLEKSLKEREKHIFIHFNRYGRVCSDY